MSITSSLFEKTPPPAQAIHEITPARISITLVVLIFLSEMVAMIIIYFVALPNYLSETLLDGIIMMILIIPILYFLQLAPLSKQINERMRAEQLLQANKKGHGFCPVAC